ncbi:MAG: hypothetical protein NVSMB22_14800 [Chloroflexota bacterium]
MSVTIGKLQISARIVETPRDKPVRHTRKNDVVESMYRRELLMREIDTERQMRLSAVMPSLGRLTWPR